MRPRRFLCDGPPAPAAGATGRRERFHVSASGYMSDWAASPPAFAFAAFIFSTEIVHKNFQNESVASTLAGLGHAIGHNGGGPVDDGCVCRRIGSSGPHEATRHPKRDTQVVSD